MELQGYSNHFGKPLLPNLRQLTFYPDRFSSVEQVNWIAVLLCSTLLDIRVIADTVSDSRVGIPEPGASALLELVARRCPALQSLKLFPRRRRHVSEHDSIIPFTSDSMSYEHLASLQHLRALTTSKMILLPEALANIGLLPNLEELVVYDSELESISSCSLPDLLFPSLRRFWLRMLPSFEVAQIWEMDALVGQLTHVHIEVEGAVEEHGLADVLPNITQNSPHTQTLIINFNAPFNSDSDSNPSSDQWIQVLDLQTIKLITQLPLRKLTLTKAELSASIDDFCHLLANSCSALRDLRLPHQLVALDELYPFTELSQLENLSVEICWVHCPTFDDITGARSAWALVSLQCGYGGADNTGYVETVDMARYVLFS
jgi:hypothetical protein